jgi:uncharacterized C2H2 Zn-finger protein
MFKCSMCGMEFTNVDEYVTHVSKCAEQYKVKESKKKEEELKKAKEVNEFVKNIKMLESQLKSMKVEFAKKYPEEYEMNFDDRVRSCEKEPKKESFYGSINGKECDNMNEFIEKLKREYGEWLW